MSYDLMMRKSKELLKKGFKVVIFDESHFLKSYQSKRANAAVPIIKVSCTVKQVSHSEITKVTSWRINQQCKRVNAVKQVTSRCR